MILSFFCKPIIHSCCLLCAYLTFTFLLNPLGIILLLIICTKYILAFLDHFIWSINIMNSTHTRIHLSKRMMIWIKIFRDLFRVQNNNRNQTFPFVNNRRCPCMVFLNLTVIGLIGNRLFSWCIDRRAGGRTMWRHISYVKATGRNAWYLWWKRGSGLRNMVELFHSSFVGY